MIRLAALTAFLALSACTSPEEPVANRYDRTAAEIENLARQLDAETENQVRGVEADVQNQTDAIANSQANQAMPGNPSANSTAPPPTANAAPANRARR